MKKGLDFFGSLGKARGILKRGNAVTSFLPWIIIGIIILVLVLIFTGVIKTTGVSLIDKARSVIGGAGS